VTANELGVFREHGNSSTILKKAPWAVACDLLALQADFGFDEAPTRSLIRAAAAPTLLFRSHGPRLQLLPYEQGPSSAGAGDGGEFSPSRRLPAATSFSRADRRGVKEPWYLACSGTRVTRENG
jgi:hypothetical protein